jgi:hypothetical protein
MPTLAFMAYSAAANQAGTLLDWLFSGKFAQFPGLKIALSEGSIGWIPATPAGSTNSPPLTPPPSPAPEGSRHLTAAKALPLGRYGPSG